MGIFIVVCLEIATKIPLWVWAFGICTALGRFLYRNLTLS